MIYLFFHSDILNTRSNQTISAKKTFTSDVHFIKDVQASGLVDGVNISHASKYSLFMNLTQNITGHKAFKNLTVHNLYLQECEHDCTLLRLLSNIKYVCANKSMGVVNVTGNKYFKNLHVFGNGEVSGSVNNVKVPGDFLIQGLNQTLSGEKVFQRNVTMAGNVAVKYLNRIDISAMYGKAITKSNLTIKSKVIFVNNLYINGNLEVTKAINNVHFEDVVATFKEQTITGKKTFKNLAYIRTLFAWRVQVGGFIDGVNLTALNLELLSLSGDKIILGTKIFKRGVSFLGNWTTPGLIDGVNITELYHNAMTLTNNQRVSGQKVTFLYSQSFPLSNLSLRFRNLVCGKTICIIH